MMQKTPCQESQPPRPAPAAGPCKNALRTRAPLQLLSEWMGRNVCDGVRSSQSCISHSQDLKRRQLPGGKEGHDPTLPLIHCPSHTKEAEEEKTFFSSCFLQKDKLQYETDSSFFPALSVPGLQRCCNTKAWTETLLSLSHIHTHSLLIFFLLRLVLLSLSVFGQSLDALSAALLSNESVRGRESERKRTRERERVSWREEGERVCKRDRYR